VAVFAGTTVLVTGGTRGIGKEIALRFADLGAARIAISSLRNDTAGEETAGELRERGAEPVLLRGNVGDPEKAASFVEEFETLDVLVSNAATGVIRPALELEERHWTGR
jgi:enoyl-[acyl-carrier protein] reductase III